MEITDIPQLLKEGVIVLDIWGPYTPVNHQLWSASTKLGVTVALVERCGFDTEASVDCMARRIPLPPARTVGRDIGELIEGGPEAFPHHVVPYP
jgi:hypothetical protein